METFIVEAVIAGVCSLLLAVWIKGYFRKSGLVGKDVHKEGQPRLPTSGGIPVFLGFYFAASAYVFLRAYLFGTYEGLLEVMAGLLAIALVTFIGFLDDLNSADGKRVGLKQWQKPLLTLPAVLPLVALGLGEPIVTLPILGAVNLSHIYTLAYVPLLFMGASNMVNLLAGLNGLESGMGIIYLTSLSLYAFFFSGLAAKIIAFAALGAVAGFFIINKFPAKMLPGDSLTYFLGAVLATIAIVGNMDKAFFVVSIPFFIELFLKLRGRLREPTVGKLVNGKLQRQGGIYSLPHLFMNGKYSERQVVRAMWLVTAIFSALAWLV